MINTRAGSAGQVVVSATDEQPTPSAESNQWWTGIPVANPVLVEQWKSQWRAISDLAQARAMRIPTALTWQCKIGIFCIRLERVSR